MSGHLPRTNRWLILLSIVLCLIFGGIFTRSSAGPSQVSAGSDAGVFGSEDPDSSEFSSEGTVADNNDNFTDISSDSSDDLSPDSSDNASAKNSTDNASETLSESTEEKSGKNSQKNSSKSSSATSSGGPVLSSDISKEASKGHWASSGSNWMFLVNAKPYTGWLTDTDGKQYYMDDTGIMQTGWTDIGKKRYYFDMDGILQTGTIKIDKKTYELNADGSLKDYVPAKNSSEKSRKSSQNSDSRNSESSGKSGEEADASGSSSNSDTSKGNNTSKENDTSTPQKAIALTFDDGPGSFTNRLLDCLEQNNAKATFFMVGTEIASFPDEVKRMKELGCELGNHTYDHTELTTLSVDQISSEIARVDEQLVNLTGQRASVVRPPYGSVNDTVKSVIGTPMILWSIDTLDWKTLDVESTVEEVMNNVKDGSVILMHDIYSTSVDAAEILIPQLIEDGYQLVTIHELAALHQTELSGGNTYSEFHGAS